MNNLTREQAHKLLMENKSHYLWNKNYNQWTEQDCENLINRVNPFSEQKPKGNKVTEQAVEVITPTGEKKQFRSIAEASRKLSINANSIYAVINGRFSQAKKHRFIRINS